MSNNMSLSSSENNMDDLTSLISEQAIQNSFADFDGKTFKVCLSDNESESDESNVSTVEFFLAGVFARIPETEEEARSMLETYDVHPTTEQQQRVIDEHKLQHEVKCCLVELVDQVEVELNAARNTSYNNILNASKFAYSMACSENNHQASETFASIDEAC